jgi:hypothetical protein
MVLEPVLLNIILYKSNKLLFVHIKLFTILIAVNLNKEIKMMYIFGWLLGIPVTILLLIWLISHI